MWGMNERKVRWQNVRIGRERNGCGPNLTLFLCHSLRLSRRSLCLERSLLAWARGDGTSRFTTLDTRVPSDGENEENDDGSCDDDDDDSEHNDDNVTVVSGSVCREI